VAAAVTNGIPARPINEEGMVTMWLNRCQSSLRVLGSDCTPILQTWNALPGVVPAPELTLRDAYFERPVVTPDSLRCIARLAQLQGHRNLWFCGSYAELGMPLLETAVTSSVRVATMLGQPCPWRKLPIGVNDKNQFQQLNSQQLTQPQELAQFKDTVRMTRTSLAIGAALAVMLLALLLQMLL
jgi:predicted NAD/FAD-binding protein